MADAVPAVSEQDVASLKDKLSTFLAALTPAEQALLGALLRRPLELAEVQGHALELLPGPVLHALTQSFSAPTASVSYLGVLDSYRPR